MRACRTWLYQMSAMVLSFPYSPMNVHRCHRSQRSSCHLLADEVSVVTALAAVSLGSAKPNSSRPEPVNLGSDISSFHWTVGRSLAREESHTVRTCYYVGSFEGNTTGSNTSDRQAETEPGAAVDNADFQVAHSSVCVSSWHAPSSH